MPLLRRWTVLAVIAGGCGNAEVPGPATASAPASAADEGDPLLVKARMSMRAGRIDADVVAEIRASDDPAHARARRILTAMDQAPHEEDTGDDGGAAAQIHVGDGKGGAEANQGPTAAPVAKDVDGDTAPAPSSAARPRATLRKLSLRSSSEGATLTLHASEGVLVGSAHQPVSGTLRLVVESVSAAPKLLGSRPASEDVRVVDVRRGEDTVIIKLAVPPGWRVGRTRRFPGGARVDLVAP